MTRPEAPQWRLHDDGAFDLLCDGPGLKHAYPSIDFQPLRPLAVEVRRDQTGGTLRYRLAEGELELCLGRRGHRASLKARLRGFRQAPHWLHPLAFAELVGPESPRLFRTGIGFSGPTGFVDLAAQNGPYAFESYLVTALCDRAERTLAIGAGDHRDYLQQCHLANRHYRANFRNREIAENRPVFEAGFRMERIPLDRAETELPALHFECGHPVYDTLRSLAGSIAEANGCRPTTPPATRYCSWYWRTRLFSQADLSRLCEGLRRDPMGVRAVQIDDGYQPYHGDWLERNDRYPGGLEEAFATIDRAGLRPGVWVGPFMVNNRSRLYREHPDWVLHDLDGKPFVEWSFPVPQGGTDMGCEESYRLDLSHPDALDYVVHVFRTLRAWGARLYKTDFLEWGWRDSTTVRRHRPGQTGAALFNRAMRGIREAIGDDSYWLGCITHFAPSLGFVDAMRVSSDCHPAWPDPQSGVDGPGGGTPNQVAETFHCQYFNQLFWQNDPDVLFLREWPTKLSPLEVETLAYFFGISGVGLGTSCPLPALSAERQALWRFLLPQDEPWTARPPFFADGSRRLRVLVRAYPALNAWAALAINPSRQRVTELLPVKELCGLESAACYDWSFRGAAPAGSLDTVVCQLDGHAHRLLYLSADHTPPPPDLTLGGARLPS